MEPLSDDKEFLLRCALTRNWDFLINFCSVILEVLSTSVRDRDVEYQHQRVETARNQLERQDQWGNTALHAACYNNPPLRVITTLLNCASVANLQNYHVMLTLDEATPLNIACATGASIDVIRALLNPPAGLCNGAIAVRISDKRGCTPLSELTIYYELQRKTPLYARTSLPLDQVNLMEVNDPLLESLWGKVELLIRSAWTITSNQHGPWISIVHGAAAIAESCPTVLTNLICRCYPAMTAFASRKGVLPLHLAIENSSANKHKPLYVLEQRRKKFIEHLINLYPSAVRQPSPTRRSVFCQAIASSLRWHLPQGHECIHNGDDVGPLQCLLRQDPGAFSIAD